ncbi:MAG: DUF5717 family protein [Lachnospiraceae bacterium]|nr:DUF5717 family protein [Lachnospiraceae bacterium]
MYEIVDKLKNGFFEYESEKLSFSVSKIESEVPVDDVCEGSFVIETKGHGIVSGKVFSSCMRLVCMLNEFTGDRIEVKYGFDPTGLEPGAVVKGDIQIVSDAGEYYIPFVFNIVRNVSFASYGKVKNLFHFSNSAQMDFKEAVSLFYSDDFKYLFEGNDRIHFDKYRGYLNDKGNSSNVELFLQSIRKKQRIEYKSEKTEYEFSNVTSDLKCEITVRKSTWGYVNVDLSTDCDFIELVSDKVTTEDFLGNLYSLTFYLREERLHEGKNFGHIFLKTGNREELRFQISASYREGENMNRIKRREMENLTLRLMRSYIAFRTKQIRSQVWVRDSMRIVERMNALDNKNPVSRLFQTQLLLVEGRATEAKWILDHVSSEMNVDDRGPEIYCYYRYLCSLYSREEDFVDQVTAEIRKIYDHVMRSPLILWILIYLDENLGKNSPQKIEMIEEQFRMGACTPILYVEAYNYFAANPSSINRLSNFELQVLRFAIRNNRMDRDILSQVLYLASRKKRISPILIDFLERAYELVKSDKIIEVICTLLIKNNETDEKYFKWYSLGVEKDINITRLYEYYMYSVPFDYDRLIQKPVFLYFGYSNDLGYEKMSMLYANLIEYKSSNPSLYEASREKMQLFAIDQIEQGHMNRELSVIYDDVIYVQLIKPSLAVPFVRILLAFEAAVSDPEIKNVVIIEEAMVKERVYPVERGYAYPVIYTGEFTAFYEDKKGNRYLADNKDFQRVMDDSLFLRAVQNYVTNDPGFALYICNQRHRYITIDHDNADYCRKLVDSDEIRESYKEGLRIGLIRYYYENNMATALDEYMTSIDPKIMGATDRAELIEYMVKRGMYERAYELITIYGAEELPSKICVKICSHMIAGMDETADPMLIKFAYHAFMNGKYDILTMKYLVDNFEGLTKELRNLWKSARLLDVECHSLVERLLVQMMFTRTAVGEKEELLEEYVKEGTRTDVELAYLSYQAYDYFAKERAVDSRVFYHLIRNYRAGEELNDAGKLAILKFFSRKEEEISERNKDMIREFILEYLHKNCYYAFFGSYKGMVPELLTYEDKTYIEYRSDPSHRVFLHYLIEDSEKEKEQYITEEMTPMFGGVFVREFILFFGENLQYYIMDEHDGEKKLTNSDSISISETGFSDHTSRYSMLNDIAVANTLQDESTVLKLMEEYVRADYFTEKAFSII